MRRHIKRADHGIIETILKHSKRAPAQVQENKDGTPTHKECVCLSIKSTKTETTTPCDHISQVITRYRLRLKRGKNNPRFPVSDLTHGTIRACAQVRALIF